MASRLLMKANVEVEIYETGLRAEYEYEARVYPVVDEHTRGTAVYGHGMSASRAAAQAMLWFAADRVLTGRSPASKLPQIRGKGKR